MAFGRRAFFLCLLSAWAACCPAQTAFAGRMGEIRMTDGTVYRGDILVRGELRLVTWAEDELGIKGAGDISELGGGSVFFRFFGRERLFDLDAVQSIHLDPRPELLSRQRPAERMERKWDWKDRVDPDNRPDQLSSEKVYIGDPFPVRELQAVVTFTSGEVLAGSLDRTAVYIYPEGEFAARRFIIRSEERGGEGEKFDDLLHVESIRFLEEGRQFHANQYIRFSKALPDDLESVWAVTHRTLTPVATEQVPGSRDTVEISGTYGEGFYIAVKKGGEYHIGWRNRADERLYRSAERHLRDLRDYYNERRLLGVCDLEGSHDVLTLVILRRHVAEGSATERHPERYGLDADSSLEFFRLAVWRWRYDPESGLMVLMKRGSFFRKQLPERGMATPPARVSESLWMDSDESRKKNIVIEME